MLVKKIVPEPPSPNVEITVSYREAQMLRAILTHINAPMFDQHKTGYTTTATGQFVKNLKELLEHITGKDRNDAYLDIKSSMVLK
jgi:hypothetical protein